MRLVLGRLLWETEFELTRYKVSAHSVKKWLRIRRWRICAQYGVYTEETRIKKHFPEKHFRPYKKKNIFEKKTFQKHTFQVIPQSYKVGRGKSSRRGARKPDDLQCRDKSLALLEARNSSRNSSNDASCVARLA